jgi:hypothetical protein
LKENARLKCQIRELGSENEILNEINKQLESTIDEIQELKAAAEIDKSNQEGQDIEYAELSAENQELQQQNEGSKRALEHMSIRYNYFIEQCIKPYVKNEGLQYDEQDDTNIQMVAESLVRDALNATSSRSHTLQLEEKLQSLQQQLLATVEKTEAVPDAQFTHDFRDLASAIKTFSRSINFSDKVDMLSIAPIRDCRLTKNVNVTCWKTAARKKFLIEAFIWSALYNDVFDSPRKSLLTHPVRLYTNYVQCKCSVHMAGCYQTNSSTCSVLRPSSSGPSPAS